MRVLFALIEIGMAAKKPASGGHCRVVRSRRTYAAKVSRYNLRGQLQLTEREPVIDELLTLLNRSITCHSPFVPLP